jgi:hypothetical protein
MCNIEGCTNNTVAKGLCAKHYMRMRRNGDASTVRKRGPASERPVGISARTWSRFKQAADMFEAMGFPLKDFERAMDKAKRRNGSINVSELLRFAQYILEDLEEPVLITPPPSRD